MIPPKAIIKCLFGVKISKKAEWIINISILLVIILTALIIKIKHLE